MGVARARLRGLSLPTPAVKPLNVPPPPLRSAGWALLHGALLAAGLALLLALAGAPSRLALAEHRAQYGQRPVELLLTGLTVDVRDGLYLTWLLGLTLLLLRSGWWLAGRRRRPAAPELHAWAESSLLTAGVLGALLLSVLWVAPTEFMIERGLYPTRLDLPVGATGGGYFKSALGTYGLERFRWRLLLTLPTLGLVGLGLVRLSRRHGARSGGGGLRLAGVFVGCVVVVGLCHVLHRQSPRWCTSIKNWREVSSPLVTFVGNLGETQQNVRLGLIGALASAPLEATTRPQGPTLLGFPPPPVAPPPAAPGGAVCLPHPLARRLDERSDTALERRFTELSEALFEGQRRPLRLWHVLLESFRADDLHVLQPLAPAALTPRMTALYEERAAQGQVIAARQLYQAGARTSHALAAVSCGLGTLPLGLSAARDLGLLSLRCLPDVLVDAGFSARFVYGSDPAFDNMLTFLRHHGVRQLLTEHDFIEPVPHQGWAVPDDRVLQQAVSTASSPRARPEYQLLMTLSHHHPFPLPEDYPPELEAQVERATASSATPLTRDDRARLRTLAYADWAFGRFIDAIEQSPDAEGSVIVAHGDHSTADRLLWRAADAPLAEPERLRALGQIPWVIVLPSATVAAAAQPDRVRSAVRALNELLSTLVLSENDLPALLLELLRHSRELRALRPEQRWHTLGGQRTSPHYQPPAWGSDTVYGFNASSELYLVGPSGPRRVGVETAQPLRDGAQLLEAAGSLSPALGLLQQLLLRPASCDSSPAAP